MLQVVALFLGLLKFARELLISPLAWSAVCSPLSSPLQSVPSMSHGGAPKDQAFHFLRFLPAEVPCGSSVGSVPGLVEETGMVQNTFKELLFEASHQHASPSASLDRVDISSHPAGMKGLAPSFLGSTAPPQVPVPTYSFSFCTSMSFAEGTSSFSHAVGEGFSMDLY